MSTPGDSSGVEYALGGKLTNARLVQTWGTAVTGGWVVTQIATVAGGVSASTQYGLTAFWLVGSLVPIAASFLWMRVRGFTGLFPVWTVLVVTGLVASFAVISETLAVGPVLILSALWFAGPAVGFLVTATYMDGWRRRLYTGAAIVNIAGAAAVVTVPRFGVVYPIVAAIVQGLPMLYHGSRLG